MKALLVARVSTLEQEEAGNSLPAQLDRMRKYSERKSFEIAEEFSFDESAYKDKRDEFDLVLDRVHASKEQLAICFDKVDRLSRNVFDKRVGLLYEMAAGSGKIELHFASDNLVINTKISATEKFNFGISLGLAKYYSDAISDNTRRAFEEKRRRGEWTGHPRIGYVQVQTRNETGEVIARDIVPDPERAHLIVRAFELYATATESVTTIHEKMIKMGLTSLDGKKVARSNIELILKDPFYCGMARSKKYGLYPHRYRVLISRELFDRCAAIREKRGKSPSKEAGKPFVMKGLLHCDNCGCLMSPEIKKGRFVYYSCTNAKGICKRDYVPENVLLKPVREIFERFNNVPQEVHDRLVSELRQVNESEVDFHNREIARIRAEYDRTQRRLANLLDVRLDGGITQDEYDKKLREMKERQYRLNIEMEEHTKADHEYHIQVSHVISLAKRMGEIFESSEPDEKRAILGYLLQNPTVRNKKLLYTLKKPYETVLELATVSTQLRG